MMCESPFIRSPIKKNPSKYQRQMLKRSKQARLDIMPLPCGKCLPCVINKRRVWTHRLMLEQMCHESSLFVTLNYPPKDLPEDESVSKSTLSGYVKRVRSKLPPRKLRYFAVGEYGLEKMRPHYHLALFGVGFSHEKILKEAWYSPERKGVETVDIGELNTKSAKYICGYTTEKLSNKDKRLFGREKEFMTCSKRPYGIGAGACAIIGKNIKKEKRINHGIYRELAIGKHKFPLGRYLTRKLNEHAGKTDIDFTVDLWKHQEEIFNNHLYGEGDYVASIMAEKEDIRKRQERLHRMFRKRKKL